MTEEEIKKYFEDIIQNLEAIKNKKSGGVLRAFFHGIFGALGYIAGIAIVLVIIGWFLNKTGLLPAFKKQVGEIQSILDQAKKFTAPEKQGSGSTIILPDSREVKIK